jgi:hypothetical protein
MDANEPLPARSGPGRRDDGRGRILSFGSPRPFRPPNDGPDGDDGDVVHRGPDAAA